MYLKFGGQQIQKNEKLLSFKGDKRVKKIYLHKNSDSKIYFGLFKKAKSIDDYSKIFNKIFNKMNLKKNTAKKVYLKNII